MKNYSVINLLENYKLNESKMKLVKYNDNPNKNLQEIEEEMNQLNYCIDCLPKEQKDIITKIYIDKISIRQLSKIGLMSRSTIARKRDLAIKMLQNLINSLNF